MDSSTKILIGVVAGVILLVILAVALPRIIDDEEAAYPPDTPEGTVQRYIRAVIDEDANTALLLLTEQNNIPCADDELRDRINSSRSLYERYRVRLGDVEEVDSETVIVTVGVVYRDEPDLFELPNNRDTFEHEFELHRTQDGYWRIAESEWPINLEHIRDDYCDDETAPTPVIAQEASS